MKRSGTPVTPPGYARLFRSGQICCVSQCAQGLSVTTANFPRNSTCAAASLGRLSVSRKAWRWLVRNGPRGDDACWPKADNVLGRPLCARPLPPVRLGRGDTVSNGMARCVAAEKRPMWRRLGRGYDSSVKIAVTLAIICPPSGYCTCSKSQVWNAAAMVLSLFPSGRTT
jgi:hypothetical protein